MPYKVFFIEFLINLSLLSEEMNGIENMSSICRGLIKSFLIAALGNSLLYSAAEKSTVKICLCVRGAVSHLKSQLESQPWAPATALPNYVLFYRKPGQPVPEEFTAPLELQQQHFGLVDGTYSFQFLPPAEGLSAGLHSSRGNLCTSPATAAPGRNVAEASSIILHRQLC